MIHKRECTIKTFTWKWLSIILATSQQIKDLVLLFVQSYRFK